MKLVLDTERCTGCGICELVCSAVKGGVFNPKMACLKIHSGYEKDDLVIRGEFCDLCLECVETCPTGAITSENGSLSVDQESCSECGLCVDACPYGIIHLSSSGKLLICDRCGGSPECVSWCPHEAIKKEESAT